MSPAEYIEEPVSIPMDRGMFTSNRARSVMAVPAQGRGGEKTHKCIDVIGLTPASHQRDQFMESLLVLGWGSREQREWWEWKSGELRGQRKGAGRRNQSLSARKGDIAR